MDIILLAISSDIILEILNSFYECFQFTLEVGENDCQNFLNVSALVFNGKNFLIYIRSHYWQIPQFSYYLSYLYKKLSFTTF